jgi:hypothetical protein
MISTILAFVAGFAAKPQPQADDASAALKRERDSARQERDEARQQLTRMSEDFIRLRAERNCLLERNAAQRDTMIALHQEVAYLRQMRDLLMANAVIAPIVAEPNVLIQAGGLFADCTCIPARSDVFRTQSED